MYNPWQLMDYNNLGSAPTPSVDAQAQLNQIAADAQDGPFVQGPLINRQGIPDYSQMKMNPGNKLGYDRNFQAKRQRTVNKTLRMTPDEYKILQKMAMGINPGIAQDEAGNDLYEQEAVTDVLGNPRYDAQGNPLSKNSETPIYDESRDTVDPNHPYQQQSRGIDQLKKLLEARIAGMPVGFDLSPLARLADYESGTHMAEQYKPNVPNWDKLVSWADEIQKRRADLNKTVKDNIQTMKSGNVMDLLLAQQADKFINEAGGPAANRQQAQESMLAHRAHIGLMNKLSKDKILNQELSGYITQSNALSALNNAKKLNLQTIHDVQQALRRGIQLGSGSQSGVDERAKTYVEYMGFNWDNVEQFITGKPTEIAKDHALVESIRDLATIEQKNMQEQFQKRLNAEAAGYGWIYDDPRFGSEAASRFDNLQQDLYEALGAYKNQVKQGGPTYRAKPAGTPAASSIKSEVLKAIKNAPSASPAPAPSTKAPPKQEKSIKDAIKDMILNGGSSGR